MRAGVGAVLVCSWEVSPQSFFLAAWEGEKGDREEEEKEKEEKERTTWCLTSSSSSVPMLPMSWTSLWSSEMSICGLWLWVECQEGPGGVRDCELMEITSQWALCVVALWPFCLTVVQALLALGWGGP